MYSQLLTSTGNIQMVEFLMAGMWILMKDPSNRRALAVSAESSPTIYGAMAGQLKDVADVADVHEEVGTRERQGGRGPLVRLAGTHVQRRGMCGSGREWAHAHQQQLRHCC